jgi:signal transduction histidine kinase
MTAKERKSNNLFILLALFCLLFGFWGTVRLSEQTEIKITSEKHNGFLRVVQVTRDEVKRSGLRSGDLLLEIDQNPIRSRNDLDFFIGQMRIGQPVNLKVQRGGEKLDLAFALGRKYNWLFLVVNFLAGIFTGAMGCFVFLKKPQSQVVKVYLASSLSLSLTLLIPRVGFPYGPSQINFLLPSIQIIAYTFLPAFFFHFSVIFPREEEISSQRRTIIYSAYLPSIVLIALMELFYWRSIHDNSASWFQSFQTLFLLFRIYLVVYLLLGLLALYRTYQKLEFLEEKRKIRWIFWGIAVGSFPFIFLVTLPDVFMGRTLIPEVIKSLFVSLIPLSFAFSILKYQTMDIDVVINRSLVYSLLTGFIVGIYLFVVGLLGEIARRFTGYQGSLFPILATLIAAVAFTPARNRIRVFVDKTFYRVRYDYRKAIQEFTQKVSFAFTQDELLELLLGRIDLLLAVKRAMIFIQEDYSEGFRIAKSIGCSREDIADMETDMGDLWSDLLKSKDIKGTKGATAYGNLPALPENQMLRRFDVKLFFPLTEKEEQFGFLLIGKKKSELKYSADDVELVSLMVQEVARSLQNIGMRERIITEQLEKEKWEELNQLKTKFISNVSHDLRTPLTAIRFSVDNMLKGVYGEVSDESRTHLMMIQESALHVSRMIDNLLTLSMSESGKIVLNKENLLLSSAVDAACSVVKILAEKKGISLKADHLQNLSVFADRHSLLQILLNLLDNAVKYNHPGGEIIVSAQRREEGKMVELSVADNGIGIPAGNLERIFERFHQVVPVGTVREKGLGIGLDIVRNLVHLHGGEIKVESPVSGTGKGAKFSFTLPPG